MAFTFTNWSSRDIHTWNLKNTYWKVHHRLHYLVVLIHCLKILVTGFAWRMEGLVACTFAFEMIAWVSNELSLLSSSGFFWQIVWNQHHYNPLCLFLFQNYLTAKHIWVYNFEFLSLLIFIFNLTTKIKSNSFLTCALHINLCITF